MRRKTFWQNRHYLSLASLSVNTCLLSQWDQNVYEVLLKFLCTFIFTKSCGLTHKKIQFSRASEMYENRYLLYPCNVFGDFCIFWTGTHLKMTIWISEGSRYLVWFSIESQILQNSDFQSHFSMSKIGQIFKKKNHWRIHKWEINFY